MRCRGAAALLAGALVSLGAGGEPEGPIDPRDEEFFGTSDDGEGARDDDIFGAEAEVPDLGARMEELDDTTDVGGLLYLRLDGTIPEQLELEDAQLASPNLLDVYLDARPNERVRAYVRGRVTHDATGGAAPGVVLDQLWLKGDLGRAVFFTVGQQPVRWGSGRFWNPTDILSKGFRAALEPFDARVGTTLVKLHLPFEQGGHNLYAIASLEGARDPEDVGGAARAELLFGTTEIALTAAARRNEPTVLGADISAGTGPLDVHLEGAARLRDDETTWSVVGGAEIGVAVFDEDTLYLGMEVFEQSEGGETLEDYLPALLSGEAVPLYLGKRYASLYAFLPAPGRLDDHSFILSGISNVSDGSYLVRGDWRVRALTHLSFNAHLTTLFGPKRGEFRGLPRLVGERPLLLAGLGLTLSL